MRTVALILASKPQRDVLTIDADGSVYDAIRLMGEKNIGALLVTEAGKTVGIVTERDYARKVVLAGRSSKDTPVRVIMSSPVMHVRPQNTAEECMALMTNSRFRHLPVLDDGKLVGIVSIGDLVKDIISEQQFIIDQLQHYITGDHR